MDFRDIEYNARAIKGLTGSAFTWLGTITAWQSQVEWFIRIMGGVGAIVVSILTIRSLLRKKQ